MEQSIQPNQVFDSQVKYAGFWQRFLASSIDGAIIILFGIGLSLSLGGNYFSSDTQSLPQVVSSVVNLLFSTLYSVFFWVKQDGATPGKKLLAIKVVKTDGSELSYGTAVLRGLSYMVSFVPLGLGYLWVAWDKNKQGWHDKLAQTYVVKTENRSRAGLAIFLSLLFWVIFLGSALISGAIDEMKTGDFKKKMQEQIIDTRPAQSQKQYKEGMSPEAKSHYEKTQELYKEMRGNIGNPETIKPIANEAIREAKKAVEIDQNNPLLWSNLGDAYTWPNTVGTSEDGLNAYKKAEELDPTNVVYINYVGDQLIRMNRNGEAVLQFQKTLRMTDTSGFAHLSIGRAYKNLKVFDEARKHFQRAIEIFQKDNKDGKYDDEILDAQKELAGIPK